MMKMAMLLLFVLAAAFEGTIGQDENFCRLESDECSRFVPASEIEKMMKTTGPNADALVRFCPSGLKSLNCTKVYSKICNMDFYEIAASMYIIAGEVCDDRSRLHEVYVRNIDCVFEMKDDFHQCGKKAYPVTDRYAKHSESLGDGEEGETPSEKTDRIMREAQCLGDYLTLACTSNNVEKKCGMEAMETLLEMATRSNIFCPPESMMEVQKKYLKMMDNDPDVTPIDLSRVLKWSQLKG